MATIKFITGRPNTKKQSVIFLQYGHAQKRVIFSTGLKINPNTDWDPFNGKVRRSHPNFVQFNETLRELESGINDIVLKILSGGKEPTVNFVRSEYRNSRTRSISFFEAFISFLNDSKGIKAASTIKIYSNLISILNQFEREINSRITFECIDGSFLERFTNFQVKQQFLNSTIRRNNSFLMAFLNDSSKKRLFDAKHLYPKRIKVPKKEAISLTEDELNQIWNAKLPESLEKIRQVFYFSCISGGIRFSDLNSIKKESLTFHKGYPVLQIHTQKTRTLTRIPLLKEAVDILHKNDCSLKTVSHQRYLKLIKRVAKLAGINKQIEIVSYSGTKKLERIVEKHSIIGSHTARRTFITLSLNKGVPIQMIASITHNNNVSSLLRYISVDEDRKVEVFNRAWEDRNL